MKLRPDPLDAVRHCDSVGTESNKNEQYTKREIIAIDTFAGRRRCWRSFVVGRFSFGRR